MVNVSLKNLSKSFGNTPVLVNMNLEIEDNSFFILLGASGSGKSTTLSIIAGLEKQTSGEVLFDGKDVTPLSPSERSVAFVFQDYALYPHMTVYKNLAFPLKMKRYRKEAIEEKVKEVAKLLSINELLDRYPRQLSGGQAQRVALGRALVRDPSIFLLDEPLSNLDAKIRSQIGVDLKFMQQQLSRTFVFVTHDQAEAMSLGSKIAILNHGTIQQTGAPIDVYRDPVNEFVATFLGEPAINLFEMYKKDGKYLNNFLSPLEMNLHEDKITIGVRPENIHLDRSGLGNNIIYGKIDIKTVELFGSYVLLIGDDGNGNRINIRTTNIESNIKGKIDIFISINDILIFDKEGKRLK